MIKNKGYWVCGGTVVMALFCAWRLRTQKQKPQQLIEFSLINTTTSLEYENRPAGIVNQGNTLALSSQPNFIEYLFELVQHFNYQITLDQQICIELAKIMKFLQCDQDVIDASTLIDLLSQDADYSFFSQQQDSHELFNMLMKHIEEANYQVNQFDLTNLKKQQMKSKNPFLYHTKMQITCNTCRRSFNLKVESNYALHFQLNYANTIQQALEHLKQPEIITDYVCFFCSLQYLKAKFLLPQQQQIIDSYFNGQNFDQDAKTLITQIRDKLQSIENNTIKINALQACQKRVVTRQTQIAKYPKTFCFFVNRLIIDPQFGYQIKLNTPIQLDSIIKITDKEQHLSAIVCHLGNSKSGHYITYKRTFVQELCSSMSEIKKYKKCEWYVTSDKTVQMTKQPEYVEAYLIFYDTY